jgi:outer membrane receptor protein involved in Fe transport
MRMRHGAALAALSVPVFFGLARAQDMGSVTGVVYETGSGVPVAGADVTVAGAAVRAVTSENGEFRLTGVPSGIAVIRVERLGYTAAERRVVARADATAEVRFDLDPLPLELDAIVVTGTAGAVRRRAVSHSVAHVDADGISAPPVNVDDFLAGRVPGVTVLQSSGMAGSGSQIRLRGATSVALGDQPLVYVDGVRVRSEGYPENVPPVGSSNRSSNDVASPLNDINPADIDRVEIVRGPAASALYGTEAAAGVIQIFTRRGRDGRAAWTAQVDQGFDQMQSFGTDASPFFGLEPWLRSGWRQKYTASVSGGGELRYYVSGTFENNEGVLPNDRQERVALRGNFDFTPAPGLDLAWSSFYSQDDLRSTPTGITQTGLLVNVYRGDGNFLRDGSKEAIDQLLDFDITTRIDHLVAGLTARHATGENLTNRLTLGYDRSQNETRNLRPFGFVFSPDGVLSAGRWENTILTVDYLGTLEHRWSELLDTTFAWGGQSATSTVSSVTGYAESFPGPGEPSLSSGAVSLAFEERMRVTNAGLFGQALVGYRDRTYLTLGLRVDGNSAFGDDFGLQPYPRVGISHVVADEATSTWGRLKLRASYGHAGRAPGPFDALRTWVPIPFDDGTALVPNLVGDANLGPERTAETEVGTEGAFFGGRLLVDASAFWQRTTDALFPVTLPPSEGFLELQLRNVGVLTNRGFELALDATVFQRPAWGWDMGLTLATSRSEVEDLGGAAPLLLEETAFIREGEPAPVLVGTHVLNPDAIGDPVIEEDHVFGPNLPTRVLGLRTTVRLPHGVEVFARGEYQGGHYIQDDASAHLAARDLWPVCADAYVLREQGRAAELTAWQRVWCDAETVPGDGPIYPADFFRLRELTVRAPLPIVVPGASTAVLTFSARNFWTWRNDEFLAFDPEMAGDDGLNGTVRLISALPPPTATYTISLRVVH